MTDNKNFLHNVFENIKLLNPETTHYSFHQRMPGSGGREQLSGQRGNVFKQEENAPRAMQPDEESQPGAQKVERILIICDQAPDEDERLQADKILMACKLDLSAKTVITATDLKQGLVSVLEADYLFLFGTGPSELGLNFELPVNRMVRLNGAFWIKTLPVKALIKSPEAKSDLWKNGLQPHFQRR